jgi:hypothetical protein
MLADQERAHRSYLIINLHGRVEQRHDSIRLRQEDSEDTLNLTRNRFTKTWLTVQHMIRVAGKSGLDRTGQ